MPTTAEIRRNINRTTLTTVMNSPRVKGEIRNRYMRFYQTTRDAIGLGVGVALGPETEEQVLAILPAAKEHAQELLATYPLVRDLYSKDLSYVRIRRTDRQQEVGAVEEILLELDGINPEHPEFRRNAGAAAARLYMAAHGRNDDSHDTIAERLSGVDGFTRFAVVMGRNERWQLPYDLPEGLAAPVESASEPAPVLTGHVLLSSNDTFMAGLMAMDLGDTEQAK